MPLNLCWLVCYSRDDKRYTEKKNKSERARRKKEDIAKIRGLVDMALGWVFGLLLRNFIVFLLPFSLDPRIKRIKQQEKEAREAKKRGTTPAGPAAKTKKEVEEEKIKAELEAKQKEEEEKVCIKHNDFRFPFRCDSLINLI